MHDLCYPALLWCMLLEIFTNIHIIFSCFFVFSQGEVGLSGEPGECGFQGDKVGVCLYSGSSINNNIGCSMPGFSYLHVKGSLCKTLNSRLLQMIRPEPRTASLPPSVCLFAWINETYCKAPCSTVHSIYHFFYSYYRTVVGVFLYLFSMFMYAILFVFFTFDLRVCLVDLFTLSWF